MSIPSDDSIMSLVPLRPSRRGDVRGQNPRLATVLIRVAIRVLTTEDKLHHTTVASVTIQPSTNPSHHA